MVYPALLPLMRTPRLPLVHWTDTPADLNGFVRFAERRNLVSARVPSHFTLSLTPSFCHCTTIIFNTKGYNLSGSINIFRMGEERGLYRVLLGKPEGRRPLGRPRRRWVDNIRMDLQEVGCGYMDWIGLAQDRDRWRTLVSAAMNLRVPWNAGNFLTSCKPVSFSRRTLHHGVSK